MELALSARALVWVSFVERMVTLALLGDGIRARQGMMILRHASQALDDLSILASFPETSQAEHVLR